MIYGHADGITGQSFAWRVPDNRGRDNGFISRLHRDESHYVLIRLAAPGNGDRERYPLYGSSSPGDPSDKVVSRDIIADRTDRMERNFI